MGGCHPPSLRRPPGQNNRWSGNSECLQVCVTLKAKPWYRLPMQQPRLDTRIFHHLCPLLWVMPHPCCAPGPPTPAWGCTPVLPTPTPRLSLSTLEPPPPRPSRFPGHLSPLILFATWLSTNFVNQAIIERLCAGSGTLPVWAAPFSLPGAFWKLPKTKGGRQEGSATLWTRERWQALPLSPGACAAPIPSHFQRPWGGGD